MDTADRWETRQQERPAASLLNDLARLFADLIRQEFALARTELGEKVEQLTRSAMLIGSGLALVFAGMLALLAAAILGLAVWISLWLSALLIGLAALAGGTLLVQLGRRRIRRFDPIPDHTLQTLRDGANWVKEQAGG